MGRPVVVVLADRIRNLEFDKLFLCIFCCFVTILTIQILLN
jgi:hypothetical protein